ncbi:MAG: gamma-glutamyl-gamma-aminobutyrate hydrolase family protein [Rhodocyclaceae bacterium]|nr:gamma-glutamyl-gamma-aminobutyrate hydrolase family protein [Rhodocyclaceae bacterium]
MLSSLSPRSALIAVSARAVSVARGADHRLRAHWAIDGDLAAALQRAGATISLLPPPEADRCREQAHRCLARADGLVLQGGGDVRRVARAGDPVAEGPGRALDELRDGWDSALLAAAEGRRLPVLGICRGLHLINVVRGGSLCVDWAGTEDVTCHDDRADYGSCRHPVALAVDGVLRTICRTDRLVVRSAHRHAVGRIGDGLAVEAVAEDGCIEALRAVDRDWLLGVQWHPELAVDAAERAPMQALLRHFVQQCAVSRRDAGVPA